jgi:hypothetical protein
MATECEVGLMESRRIAAAKALNARFGTNKPWEHIPEAAKQHWMEIVDVVINTCGEIYCIARCLEDSLVCHVTIGRHGQRPTVNKLVDPIAGTIRDVLPNETFVYSEL